MHNADNRNLHHDGFITTATTIAAVTSGAILITIIVQEEAEIASWLFKTGTHGHLPCHIRFSEWCCHYSNSSTSLRITLSGLFLNIVMVDADNLAAISSCSGARLMEIVAFLPIMGLRHTLHRSRAHSQVDQRQSSPPLLPPGQMLVVEECP